HPLLAEMLRSELQTHRPGEVQRLNLLAAGILQARGDVAGAVRCLLAAGDTDRAFSIVFEAAYGRYDLVDIPAKLAFVNLFPRELVTESVSRMLMYGLMLGLSGQGAEAHAWLERARVRIGDEPQPRAEDVATLDALRLFAFTVSAGAGDEIDAGRRAVEAVEAGLDLGVVGARVRMNLVRGYLLVDKPGEADSVLRAGSPGDAIAALRRLDEIIQVNRFGRVYEVLIRLEKARVAAALDDFDDVFATLREAGKLIAHLPRSALQHLVDAAAARWHLEAGQTRQAEELIAALPDGGPAHTLLGARLDLACGRFDEVRARLRRASPATMRDRL